MKKLVLVFLIIFIVGTAVFMLYQLRIIKLVINDELIELDDPVIIEEGVIFVPAKPVFEELGAFTRWDGNNQIFTAVLGDFIADLPVDSKEVTIDGRTVTWEAPVKLIKDTVYAPVEDAAEALGAFVDFNQKTREVLISTPREFDPDQGDEQEGPLLHVSYPPAYQTRYYADSLFVFGTTQSYAQIEVTVNGEPVDIIDRRSGNFLTMVDIPRGEEFTIRVEASDGIETTTVERSVIHPEGLQTMPEEPLEIHSSHLIPREDQVLNPGDSLRIVVRGSPGARAYYRIGQGSYIRMTELAYPAGPPGRGGIYSAVYTVGSYAAPAQGASDFRPITVVLEKGGKQVHRELPGQVAFLSDLPYKVLEVRDEAELDFSGWFRIIRDDTYHLYSATQGGAGYPDAVVSYLTPGTRFEAVGASGSYYRVRLAGDETYLLHRDAVRELEDIEALEPTLSDVKLVETGGKVSLRLEADERFPFLIASGTDRLAIKMYGIEKKEELHLPEVSGSLLELNLEPVAGRPGALELTVGLDFNFSGFTPRWDDTTLVIDLDKPPRVSAANPLQGKTIVIDPGHGGDKPGAAGPGHLDEKDVVLSMSLFLRDLLMEEGAEVIMTRTEDVDVALYDRPRSEYIADTDFFISIHTNAHAHGARAVDAHGIMTLYNYDHNEKLADIMLDTVAEAMDLPAMFTWRRNIAVTRYTQFPCVLLEAGYMMHPEDNWHILHPRGQKAFAEAIKEGIKEYFLSISE